MSDTGNEQSKGDSLDKTIKPITKIIIDGKEIPVKPSLSALDAAKEALERATGTRPKSESN